jgi:cytochrome c oxidase subunit IV
VAERLLRALTVLLVSGVAGLAFVVSFEAISAFAVTTGAFPPALGWCAPLLVDTFTAAATLVVWSRSQAGLGAGYARSLVAAATVVSLALNVAHAPDRLAARLVAVLPPLALLAAVELVMSEARRTLAHPDAPQRAGAALLDPTAASSAVLAMPARVMTQRGATPAAPRLEATRAVDAGDSRTRVRALLAGEQAGGPRLTGKQVAAAVGIKPRRAQELLRELRAEAAASNPSEQLHPALDAGAP